MCVSGNLSAGSLWAWCPHDGCRHLAILVARAEASAKGICILTWQGRGAVSKMMKLKSALSTGHFVTLTSVTAERTKIRQIRTKRQIRGKK